MLTNNGPSSLLQSLFSKDYFVDPWLLLMRNLKGHWVALEVVRTIREWTKHSSENNKYTSFSISLEMCIHRIEIGYQYTDYPKAKLMFQAQTNDKAQRKGDNCSNVKLNPIYYSDLYYTLWRKRSVPEESIEDGAIISVIPFSSNLFWNYGGKICFSVVALFSLQISWVTLRNTMTILRRIFFDHLDASRHLLLKSLSSYAL